MLRKSSAQLSILYSTHAHAHPPPPSMRLVRTSHVTNHTHLDLALPLPNSRLIDGHLYGLFIVGHHDGAESTVLCVHLAEEAMHFPYSISRDSIPALPRYRLLTRSDETVVSSHTSLKSEPFDRFLGYRQHGQ